ncbi:bacterio-opsin activator [Halobacteriales archaeon QS_4_70_19]|nr:MAG: bacterio-opsin activator [Halobacteriales archaeon QS_4_70_19]
MSLIADIAFCSPLMEATAAAVPETTFRMEDLQLVEDGPAKYLFWAEGGDLDRLDDALVDDPTVASFTRLRVSFAEAMKPRMTYLDATVHDIVYLEMRSTHEETRVRARVPTRAALQAYVETCREKDIEVQVEGLYREEDHEQSRFGLTDPQREALVAAHEAGYFDSERAATLAEIADDLGISRQALAGRLRRGHRQLIDATLR